MQSRIPRAVAFPIALWSLMLAPATGAAEQFVLFDVTFTYTKADADNSKPSKSHYYVREPQLNPQRPKDWTDPVDYRNGTIHIRTEVLEKPAGGEPTTWSICFIPNRGQKNGYGCTGTVLYKEAGVYEQDVKMTSFWQNDSIVWSEGIKQMDLVIKDGSGGSGHAHKRADFEKFFPTKIRMTVVPVSAGAKYDPSLVPNLPPAKEAGDEQKQDQPVPNGAASESCCVATETPQARTAITPHQLVEAARRSHRRRSLRERTSLLWSKSNTTVVIGKGGFKSRFRDPSGTNGLQMSLVCVRPARIAGPIDLF